MQQPSPLFPPPVAPPPVPQTAHNQRVSVCVFTNGSFPFSTLIAYDDKGNAETWLSGKQKDGIRPPRPYVLQYEIVVWKSDWKAVAADIDAALARYERPCMDLAGKNNVAWLSRRYGFVIRRLRRAVGRRRRVRHQYFNEARRWRRVSFAVCFAVGFVLPWVVYYRF